MKYNPRLRVILKNGQPTYQMELHTDQWVTLDYDDGRLYNSTTEFYKDVLNTSEMTNRIGIIAAAVDSFYNAPVMWEPTPVSILREDLSADLSVNRVADKYRDIVSRLKKLEKEY